jgi:hypothetical protein
MIGSQERRKAAVYDVDDVYRASWKCLIRCPADCSVWWMVAPITERAFDNFLISAYIINMLSLSDSASVVDATGF